MHDVPEIPVRKEAVAASAETRPSRPPPTPRGETREASLSRPSGRKAPPPGPATGLRGRVLRSDGRRAAGAEVRLREFLKDGVDDEIGSVPGAFRTHDGRVFPELRASADEEGRFRFTDLATMQVASSCQVSARLGDGVASAAALLPPRNDEIVKMADLVLLPGGWIEGLVQRAQGVPVASVRVVCPDAGPEAAARSDARGRFRLGPLAAGEHHPTVQDERWPCWPDRPLVTVLTAQTAPATVRVREAGPLRVEVADEEERAVPNVVVRVERREEGYWGKDRPAPSGVAQFVGVPRTPRRVLARIEGSSVFAIRSVGPDTTAVRVTMGRKTLGVVLRGTVVDARTGRPVREAHVSVEVPDASQDPPWHQADDTWTDDQGRFVFPAAPARPKRCRSRPEGG